MNTQEAPRLATYADVAKVVKGVEWIWPGHFPVGHNVVVVGQPGIGKSLLLLDVIKRLLDGAGWADGQKSEALRSVMWIDTEGTQSVTADRLASLSIDLGRVLLPFSPDDPLRDLRLDDNEGWESVQAAITRAKTRINVVDSLCGGHDGDEDKSRDMNRALGKLQRLARDTRALNLISHHIRKRDESKPAGPLTLDSVRGSTAITANARAVFCIEPADYKDADGPRIFRCLKSNLDDKPEPLGFVTDGPRVLWTPLAGAAERKSQLEAAKDFTLRLLAAGPVAAERVKAEAEKAGHAWRTLGRAKKALGVTSRLDGNAASWDWVLPQGPPS